MLMGIRAGFASFFPPSFSIFLILVSPFPLQMLTSAIILTDFPPKPFHQYNYGILNFMTGNGWRYFVTGSPGRQLLPFLPSPNGLPDHWGWAVGTERLYGARSMSGFPLDPARGGPGVFSARAVLSQ